jgi:hypothetical protein
MIVCHSWSTYLNLNPFLTHQTGMLFLHNASHIKYTLLFMRTYIQSLPSLPPPFSSFLPLVPHKNVFLCWKVLYLTAHTFSYINKYFAPTPCAVYQSYICIDPLLFRTFLFVSLYLTQTHTHIQSLPSSSISGAAAAMTFPIKVAQTHTHTHKILFLYVLSALPFLFLHTHPSLLSFFFCLFFVCKYFCAVLRMLLHSHTRTHAHETKSIVCMCTCICLHVCIHPFSCTHSQT